VKKEYTEDDIRLLMLLPLINRTILTASGARKLGYTKTQLIILAALALKDRLTMSQIAKYISSSKEQATRAVAPLADAGYVERRVNPDNRTQVFICMTDAGFHFLKECRQQYCQNLHAALDGVITPDEKEKLFESIDYIINILGKLE